MHRLDSVQLVSQPQHVRLGVLITKTSGGGNSGQVLCLGRSQVGEGGFESGEGRGGFGDVGLEGFEEAAVSSVIALSFRPAFEYVIALSR